MATLIIIVTMMHKIQTSHSFIKRKLKLASDKKSWHMHQRITFTSRMFFPSFFFSGLLYLLLMYSVQIRTHNNLESIALFLLHRNTQSLILNGQKLYKSNKNQKFSACQIVRRVCVSFLSFLYSSNMIHTSSASIAVDKTCLLFTCIWSFQSRLHSFLAWWMEKVTVIKIN